MAIDQTKKSNRLLGSRRFTSADLNTSQEAFQSNIDIQASEVYTQANLIPTSSLPFSGSSQHESIHQVNSNNVLKYYYRQRLTKSNIDEDVWFFITPTGSAGGVTPQLIQNGQQTSFISPKYSISALANANTEDSTPGYGVKVFVSTSEDSASLSNSDIVSTNDYQFDYKTGVLQFESARSSNEIVYMTTYQYVGKTLENDDSIGGGSSFTAAGISGSLGPNATLIRSLTAASISGSGGLGSSLTETGISGSWQGELSSSVYLKQVGSTISGSFTSVSSSFSSRVTTNELASASISTRLTTEEANIDTLQSRVDQSLKTTDSPTFGGLTVQGKLTAETYAVSSSVTHMTRSFSSGSTIFGDSVDDTHQFTGSILMSGGSISPSSISGSLGPNSTLLRGLTASKISGSFSVDRLPSGVISGSNQLPVGIISGSNQLPVGIISGSTQLPSGIISGSDQISQGFGNVSGSKTSTGSFGSVYATYINGDGSGITNLPSTDLVNDATPQLGGNLDLNSRSITGTGNIAITGSVSLDTQAFKYGVTTWKEAAGVNEFSGSSWEFKATKGSGDLFDFRDNNNNLVFKATQDKVLVFGEVDGDMPAPIAGGLIYSGSNAWYLGYENDPE